MVLVEDSYLAEGQLNKYLEISTYRLQDFGYFALNQN